MLCTVQACPNSLNAIWKATNFCMTHQIPSPFSPILPTLLWNILKQFTNVLFRPLILVQKPRSGGRMPLIDWLNRSRMKVFLSQILPERHLIFPIPPNSSHERSRSRRKRSSANWLKAKAQRTFNDFRIFSRRPSRSPMSQSALICPYLPLSFLPLLQNNGSGTIQYIADWQLNSIDSEMLKNMLKLETLLK